MSRSVIVIGGGVIGLSCAYYLAKSGHRVTVLERGSEHHDCCSMGNAGMVVPSHFEPLAAPGMIAYGMRMMLNRASPFGMKLSLNPELVRWGWIFAKSCRKDHVERGSHLLRDLNMASRELYLQFSEEQNQPFGLQKCGLVMLCATQKSLDHELSLADRAEKMGLQVKRLNENEVAALEPNTALRAAGGVHFLDDCHLNPMDLMAALRSASADHGVEFRFGQAVRGFRQDGRRIRGVKTLHEELEADEVVLAAGAWSGELAKQMHFRMPMQGGKGYSADLPRHSLPRHCFILVEARIAVTPMNSSLRFAGTMEIVGDNLSVNQAKYKGLLQSIPDYMPGFEPDDFADLQPWAGLRPCSADGLPYLGRPGHLDNVVVATGHSMMGVSLGPISGKIVADLIDGQNPEFDMPAMRPDRFN